MKKLFGLFLILAFFAGCVSDDAIRESLEKVTPPEDDQLARELIESLRLNNLDFIISKFERSQLGEKPKESLLQLYEYIDHDTPINVELVGCNVGFLSMTNKPSQKQTSLTYQIEFPNSWYTANIVIITENNTKKAFGFHINKTPSSLQQINQFTIKDKSIYHLLILIVAIFIPIYILFALIVCIFTKVKLKWLWIIFILLGVSKVTFNWTAESLLFYPLCINIQLFGVGVMRNGLYAPWIFTLSFPLGATLFLLLRKKIQIRKKGISDTAAPEVPVTST